MREVNRLNLSTNYFSLKCFTLIGCFLETGFGGSSQSNDSLLRIKWIVAPNTHVFLLQNGLLVRFAMNVYAISHPFLRNFLCINGWMAQCASAVFDPFTSFMSISKMVESISCSLWELSHSASRFSSLSYPPFSFQCTMTWQLRERWKRWTWDTISFVGLIVTTERWKQRSLFHSIVS